MRLSKLLRTGGRCCGVAAVLMVTACSTQPLNYQRLPGLAGDAECRSLLTDMQARIEQAEVGNAYGQPLRDYPYLRTNRLLASFATELDSDDQRREWLARLRALATETRQTELDNLPVTYRPAVRQQIEACIDQLAHRDRNSPQFWQRLQQQARVGDAYHGGLRVFGLYPFTRLPVLRAISNEHATWQRQFNNPVSLQGESLLYRPASIVAADLSSTGRWLAEGRARSHLGIPEPTPEQLQQLFASYAPAWRVYQRSMTERPDADRIGRIGLTDGEPYVDTADPVTYWFPSWTRYRGDVLLQLNYLIWFPERAPQKDGDIYAGVLDGLIWRVTLDPDGEVFSYDSIHPCGCYHKVYPVSDRYRIRAEVSRDALRVEPPLVLTRQLPDPAEGRLVVHLSSSAHYVVGLTALNGRQIPQGSLSYRMLPYRQLTSLRDGERRRSLFAADGLVPASARNERYLLWPMGVRSAGAMRQRGHHAISFTGIRHFDDPRLMENFFQQN